MATKTKLKLKRVHEEPTLENAVRHLTETVYYSAAWMRDCAEDRKSSGTGAAATLCSRALEALLRIQDRGEVFASDRIWTIAYEEPETLVN